MTNNSFNKNLDYFFPKEKYKQLNSMAKEIRTLLHNDMKSIILSKNSGRYSKPKSHKPSYFSKKIIKDNY